MGKYSSSGARRSCLIAHVIIMAHASCITIMAVFHHHRRISKSTTCHAVSTRPHREATSAIRTSSTRSLLRLSRMHSDTPEEPDLLGPNPKVLGI